MQLYKPNLQPDLRTKYAAYPDIPGNEPIGGMYRMKGGEAQAMKGQKLHVISQPQQ